MIRVLGDRIENIKYTFMGGGEDGSPYDIFFF